MFSAMPPPSDAARVQSPLVVLAHPRTGSSLLMQTLAILGAPWVGRFHRDDLGVAANPKGYFEDADILAQGLTAEQIARTGPVDGCAVKIGLANMMRPTRLPQWQALAAGGARLLIPIRCPLESAVSLRCFNPAMEESRQFFIETTAFLYNYTRDYVALANILTCHVRDLKASTALFPYALHVDDPAGFVRQVGRFAGLTPDAERERRAIGNIEADLYRVRLSDMPDDCREWYDKAPAKQVYRMLSDSLDPWTDIAAWAVANGISCPIGTESRNADGPGSARVA